MAELLRKPPANPPALRPAASFIIAATEEGGDPEQYRVLMIQRAARGPFGGLTVYPGGAVEKCDGEGWEELVLKGIEERRGISRAEAEKVLAQKTHGDGIEVGLEYYVGAIREVSIKKSRLIGAGIGWDKFGLKCCAGIRAGGSDVGLHHALPSERVSFAAQLFLSTSTLSTLNLTINFLSILSHSLSPLKKSASS